MEIVKKITNEKCLKIAAGVVATMVIKANSYQLMQTQLIIIVI
jgi:hypothetical protein